MGIVDPLFGGSAVRGGTARSALRADLQVQASLPLIEPDIHRSPGRLLCLGLSDVYRRPC
jgi:hypothetical protein